MQKYELLPWLVEAPADFRSVCNELAAKKVIQEEDLQHLTPCRLNINQLTKLASLVKSAEC